MDREKGTQFFDANHTSEMYAIYNEYKDQNSFYVGACLAGLDTPEAWMLREEMLAKYKNEGEVDYARGVAQGLAGLYTSKAMKFRLELVSVAPECVGRSIAGNNNEEGQSMRQNLLENYSDRGGVKEAMAESLAGLDDEESWRLREQLLITYPLNVFEGLVGVNSEKAWKLRENYASLEPNVPVDMKDLLPGMVGASMAGGLIKTQRGKRLVEQLLKNEEAVPGVIISLIGLDDDFAWELRDKYLTKFPFQVGTSLAGLQTERAWTMRRNLKKMTDDEKDIDKKNQILKGFLQGLNSNYIFEAIKGKIEN